MPEKIFDVFIEKKYFEYIKWENYETFKPQKCHSIVLSYDFSIFFWYLWIFLIILNLIIFIKILKFKK